jgi:hypothetical protein
MSNIYEVLQSFWEVVFCFMAATKCTALSLSLSQLWRAFISAGGIMEEMRGLLEQANAVMQEELNLELESVSLTGTDIIFEDSQPPASPSEQVVHNTGSHQQVNICIFDVR